jgi:hypothetical protein
VQAAISKPKTKIERIAFSPVVSFRCDALAAPRQFTINHIGGIARHGSISTCGTNRNWWLMMRV